MKYLQEQADSSDVQIIVTTHSPNLASVIRLENMVMLQNGHAFSLAEKYTNLEPSDYRFLERFLDVTKANLFFARGVMIVEGDAENILLPTLAKLIGRDFTDYGVSIVNVAGVGLRRYARIFQRCNAEEAKSFNIPVACITDMDVKPNCAKSVITKKLPIKEELGEAGLRKKVDELCKKTTGQTVKTFVANEWTLEYDLAYFGLAEEVYVAARLAKKDASLAKKGENLDEQITNTVKQEAINDFEGLNQKFQDHKSKCSAVGCSHKKTYYAIEAYSQFENGTKASKTIAAQYLASLLDENKKELTPEDWRKVFPPYLVQAIDYVTSPIGAASNSGIPE